MLTIVRPKSFPLARYKYVSIYTSVVNQSKVNDLSSTTKNILPSERSLQASSKPEPSANLASFIHKYYNKIIGTYEELSGAREIRAAQEKVIQTQEKLKDAQEEKRKAVLGLLDIRKNLQTLNNDIHAMDKGNPHYLELVRRQIELLQAEREQEQLFKVLDETEKSLFTELTSMVKISHDSERKHAENAKYISLVLTIVGTLLGAIITAARNHRLRNISDQGEKIDKHIDVLEQELRKEFEELQKRLEAIERNQKIYFADQKSQKKIIQKDHKKESWSEYFYRHANGFYRYFFPKQSNQK